MFIVMGVVGLVVAAAWFLLYRDADRHGTEEDRAYIRAGDTARTSSPVGIKWGRFVQMPNHMGHDHRQLRRRLSDGVY
jgi:hypothetical protein